MSEGLVVAALDGCEFEEHSRFRSDARRRRERVGVGQVGQLRPRIELAQFAQETVFQEQRLVGVGKLAALRTTAPGLAVVAPEEVAAGRRSEDGGKTQRVGGHDLQGARRVDAKIRVGRSLALVVHPEESGFGGEKRARQQFANRVQLVFNLQAKSGAPGEKIPTRRRLDEIDNGLR